MGTLDMNKKILALKECLIDLEQSKVMHTHMHACTHIYLCKVRLQCSISTGHKQVALCGPYFTFHISHCSLKFVTSYYIMCIYYNNVWNSLHALLKNHNSWIFFFFFFLIYIYITIPGYVQVNSFRKS